MTGRVIAITRPLVSGAPASRFARRCALVLALTVALGALAGAPAARAAPGDIFTVAGSTFGLSGDGGAATAAKLNYPFGVAVTADGGYLIADTNNHRVREVYRFAATAAACGKITFTSTKRVKIGTKKAKLSFAKTFTAPATGKLTVRLKLSRKNLKALKHAKRLRFKVTVTLAAKTFTTKVTLKAPKKS